eukprot:TRINITY_DN25983_c0_g2_i1.p1 TRINITY_DN25983_c0_g2~~TRINITY_DN25983_c0_g2_i1.p1  ORF type:complete len:201 (+),score=15.58 TRINITY_DN25983_c0_g2_i1:65-667(+)
MCIRDRPTLMAILEALGKFVATMILNTLSTVATILLAYHLAFDRELRLRGIWYAYCGNQYILTLIFIMLTFWHDWQGDYHLIIRRMLSDELGFFKTSRAVSASNLLRPRISHGPLYVTEGAGAKSMAYGRLRASFHEEVESDDDDEFLRPKKTRGSIPVVQARESYLQSDEILSEVEPTIERKESYVKFDEMRGTMEQLD